MGTEEDRTKKTLNQQGESGYQNVTPEEFAGLDFHEVTLLDLREPDLLLIDEIPGAVNLPFSQFPSGLDQLPKEKPVYVYCSVGDFSEEVAEILADRGYTVFNLEGGYNAYRKLRNERNPHSTSSQEQVSVENTAADKNDAADQQPTAVYIDARTLRCPGPIVKVADTLRELQEGTEVKVDATEDAFYSDIQVWTERTGNKLLSIEKEDGVITARIRKRSLQGAANGADTATASGPERFADGDATPAQSGNDKTFVVFSGDLDKTIAAFIMANGAASLGRKVTMFFTFWGLNILRKPEKVSVTKTLIEKMFGLMMPRGTAKLGLSRMNMGGMGAKMIRAIMKEKGVSSLEELIADARAHGVRLVACQMSMDIMGIHQEELIDGVELGGVATFIGSGETSDMSLFI